MEVSLSRGRGGAHGRGAAARAGAGARGIRRRAQQTSAAGGALASVRRAAPQPADRPVLASALNSRSNRRASRSLKCLVGVAVEAGPQQVEREYRLTLLTRRQRRDIAGDTLLGRRGDTGTGGEVARALRHQELTW